MSLYSTWGQKASKDNSIESRIQKLETHLSSGANISHENPGFTLRSFAVKVDESLAEMEDKLVEMITERLGNKPTHTRSRSKSRSKSPNNFKQTSSKGNKKRNSSITSESDNEKAKSAELKAIEKVVNKWTEKIEEQVNIIHDQVEDKMSINDFNLAFEQEKKVYFFSLFLLNF